MNILTSNIDNNNNSSTYNYDNSNTTTTSSNSTTTNQRTSNNDNKNIVEEIKKLDINFNRLIQSCEKLISNDPNNPILTVEKYVPVLFTKLRQIKELIENYSIVQATDTISPSSSSSIFKQTLSKTSGKGSSNASNTTISAIDNVNNIKPYQIPTKEVLNEYTRKVNVLFGLVNQGKLDSQLPNKLSMIRLQSSYIPHAQKMNEVHAVLKTKNKEEKKKTDILLPSTTSTTSPSIHFRNTIKSKNDELKQLLGDKHGGDMDDDEVDSSFHEITQRQRKLQTEYTDELISSSKYLKEYSERMSLKLQSDNQKIDELSSILTNNHTKIGEQNERLVDYNKKSSSDTLNYCIIVILVIVVFMGTYMLIKLFPKTS